MKQVKDDIDYDDLEESTTDTKNKQKIRAEKHGRLMRYFEEKRLKEDLDFIDGW